MAHHSLLTTESKKRSEHDSLVLTLAMQSSHMGAWERDLATETVWWSRELEQIFGLEEGEFGGTEEEFFKLIYEPDRAMAFREVRSAIEEKRAFQYEFRFVHRDGSVRWMEGRGQAIYSTDGQPLKLYGVGIDITRRKEAEERARLITEINEAVQSLVDPAEIMVVTARMLGEHLDADRCSYAEIEDESIFVITGDYTRGVPSMVGRWPGILFGEECLRVLRANEPFIFSDAEDDPRITEQDREAYRSASLRAAIAIPLFKEGKFTAGMAVHRTTVHHWTENEIETTKLVVNRCWETLERARAARRVQESEERFRLALSSNAVTVYEQDADLRYRWIYPEMYGEVIGRTDEELALGESAAELIALKRRVMETGEALRQEVAVQLPDHESWYDLIVEPRYDAEGKIAGVGGTALNITDRIIAERELRAAAERLNLAFTAADLGDWTWDVKNDLVDLSPRALDMFGLQPQESLSWEFLREMLHPDDRKLAADAVQRSLETGERYSIEYRVNRPDGTEAWISALGRATYDADGTALGMYGIVQDVTERKNLQRVLAESEARFRGLMEQAPMSIQLYDTTGRHLQVNRAWEELWGLKFTDIPDYNVLEDPQLERKGVTPVLRRVFAGEAAELPLIAYDPEETTPGLSENPEPVRWVSAIAYPLKAPDGTVREVALVHRDVTEQKRAEQEVSFQKTVLESLTESVLDGISIVSPDGKLLHYNQKFLEIWNFPQEVLELGSDDAALEWAAQQTSDPEAFLARVREVYADNREQAREELEMRDGRVYERFGAPVFHGETRLGWVWTFRDITDRKRIEQDLERRVDLRTAELARTNEMLRVEIEERARAEQERIDLLKRIFTIQEDERGRIARDIHDQLGQRLTALRFKAALIKDNISEKETLAQQTDELQEIAERLDSELSFIAWELRPSILDDLSFSEAIKNYLAEWSRHSNVAADFHWRGDSEISLSKDIETNLYRIVQEALNNTAKHAQATSVNVLLEQRPGEVLLIVEDDGVGINSAAIEVRRRHGLGLRGMRERASLIGATVDVESSSAGTSIYVRVPMPADDELRTPTLTGEDRNSTGA